jgi:hypothetical protein
MNSVVRAMLIMYVRCESVLGHTYKSLTCGYALPGMVEVRKAAGHRHGGSSPSRTPALCPCRDDASPAADPIEARLTARLPTMRCFLEAGLPPEGSA